MKPNGVILHLGPSLIDGAPIVVIATGIARGSTNRKTGDMVQTYILRADVEPTAAIKSGADASICGDCVHRGTQGKQRTCYVNAGQGPLAVYRAWKRGVYPSASTIDELMGVGEGRIVRLGTYGDPAAVPGVVWAALVASSKGHTGYTHQWRRAPHLKGLCMASADSVRDAEDAQLMGWRTFRVAMPCDSRNTELEGLKGLALRESVCPASAEAGKKLTCEKCLACAGADGRKGSIVIQAHGGFAVMANIKKRSELNL
jgi:hypothetical protein